MRILILLAIGLLAACSSGESENQQAVKQAADFYEFYLPTFAGDPPSNDSVQMRCYVSAETLRQFAVIDKIPEQEILGSDYFTYTQDYDQAWIPALKVGPAHDLMGGKVVDVSLGIEEGKHKQLEAYVRKEAGAWKIYRVRDISNNYEAPIFDAGRIKRGW